MKLFVLIPSWQEASLPEVLGALLEFNTAELDIHVYGSGFTGLQGAYPAVQFTECESETRGVGALVRRGLSDAAERGADGVVKLDGDGQCAVATLSAFVDSFQRGEDLVIASRYQCEPSEAPPLDRRLLSITFTAAINEVTGWRLTDAVSGYFGLSRRLALRLLPHLQTEGYGIGLEILLRSSALHYDACEISTQANYRYGNPKFRILYAPESLIVRVERAAVYLHVLTETLQSIQRQSEQVSSLLV